MVKDTIFVDTSAWYATVDKSDRDHVAAVAKIQNLDRTLVTSNYIFDETLTLLKIRLGPNIAIQLGEKLWNQEVGILMERLKINTVFAFDDYFAQYGKFMIL